MKCNKCNRPDLLPSDFVFKNKEKGILQTVCKVCQREYKLKHYYANKQQHFDRNEKTRQKLKEYSDSVKAKGCSRCSEKEICCMDFHHLGDKDIEVAKLIGAGSMNRLIKEISKCIVLCSNCHRKEHKNISMA